MALTTNPFLAQRLCMGRTIPRPTLCAFMIHNTVNLAFTFTTPEMFLPFYQTAWHHKPASGYLQRHSFHNLKFIVVMSVCAVFFLNRTVFMCADLILTFVYFHIHACVYRKGAWWFNSGGYVGKTNPERRSAILETPTASCLHWDAVCDSSYHIPPPLRECI